MPKSVSLCRAAHPLALAALAVAVAVASALAPGQARASAFQLKENSAKALGRAFAGSTTAGGDASVVVNNPAAMTLLKGNTIQADLSAINFSAKFKGAATDIHGSPISGGQGGDAGGTTPVPALFMSSQINDRLHLGFGFDAPFGSKSQYKSGWIGRYHAIKSDLKSLDATLSLSYDVSRQFTLGLSAIVQKTSVEFTNAINFHVLGQKLINQAATTGALTKVQAQNLVSTLIPGTDGYNRIKVDDQAYGYQIGALWKLTPSDRLGLSYRSQIEHTLEGDVTFQVPAALTMLMKNGAPFTDTRASVPFSTPEVASLSYWHQDRSYGLGMDLSWTKWSVLKELRVSYANKAQPQSVKTLNWRNTYFVSVGGDYYASDKLTLRYGVAIDTTPTYVAVRDPRVPDSNRQWLSLGLSYQATNNMELNAGFAHIMFNKAHIDAASPTHDHLVGNSSDAANVLSLSAAYHF